jgi:ribose transport system substrate-binding protein
MGTHTRRQAILAMLAKAGDVHVDALASALHASPNTIRNDLNALERAGLLRRVRGGAVPRDAADVSGNGVAGPGLGRAGSDAYAARLAAQEAEKEWIGAWSAGLVRDGDALILDASTTVFRMAAHLRDRQNLTVVTNGLNVALLLAQTPSNKVILAASEVRPGGFSVVGRLNPDLLTHFYASKCFVSCTGFALEQGLTELNVDEAIPKQQMMALAREVIALVDHTKFGTVSAYRFADAAQIHHLVVDEGIDAATLAALRAASEFAITVVAPGEARTIEPVVLAKQARRYRIGFGNMTEKMLFAQEVRRSLERAAREVEGVELLVRDNDMDRATSLANVEWFIANQIDLMIEYQVDAQAGNIIMDRFNQAGIPVIAVDIPLPGATFFGADNYRAGAMAGEALGRWVAEHWDKRLDLLLRLEAPQVGPPGARIQGQQEGLESIIGPLAAAQVNAIDFPVLVDEAERAMAALLPGLPLAARIAIVGINDEAVLGALAAFEAAGRLDQVVAVGQNGDALGRAALRRRDFPFIGSTAYAPERYGEQLLALALRILRGEPTPPAVYCQHVFLTRATIDAHDPREGDGPAPDPAPALGGSS